LRKIAATDLSILFAQQLRQFGDIRRASIAKIGRTATSMGIRISVPLSATAAKSCP